jgi:hypothetical protein
VRHRSQPRHLLLLRLLHLPLRLVPMQAIRAQGMAEMLVAGLVLTMMISISISAAYLAKMMATRATIREKIRAAIKTMGMTKPAEKGKPPKAE